jgi:glutamine kinase
MPKNEIILKNMKLFNSKSSMLKLLKNQLKKSKIEKIYDFSVNEWNNDPNSILNDISREFSGNIIIRSSAKGEDSLEQSQAGNYESILNINPKSKTQVKKSIKFVANSYTKKGNLNNQNLILIQTQTENIKISGVIFSKTPDFGSPYYVINYEMNGSTDGVTKGIVNNTIKIFRNTHLKDLTITWNLLLKSIQEIEQLLKNTFLDIEFGITKSNTVVIFQVRPLTTLNDKKISLGQKISKSIESSKNKFSKKSKEKFLIGKQVIFSDMTDWNPAEIIGNNTNYLDYSIYENLIMKEAWHKGRSNIGYQPLKNQNLMVKFGNKPYIDTRASFNSLIPNNVNKNLRKKLMNFYYQKLKNYPHLHDKVEFEILFTCYEPFIENRLKELKSHNFSDSEILILKTNLLDFTNNLIQNFNKISKESYESIELMKKNRLKILSDLKKSKNTPKEILIASKLLLDDCKKLGTIPFSTMARLAFVSSIILKSMAKNGKISEKTVEIFMNSINSPLSNFQNDLQNFSNKKITKKDFLEKYGHLRPGTYDITAMRYDKDPQFLKDISSSNYHIQNHEISKDFDINLDLKEYGLDFTEIDFYDFVKKSIVQREELKFEFTKNLSDALELIAEVGSKLNFSRKEMAYLDYKIIFNDFIKYKKNDLIFKWRKNIIKRKNNKFLNDHIVLPPLIISVNDFNIIKYPIAKPNFITNKKFPAKVIHIDKIEKVNELMNKIVILENADPGYDWIFSHNLAGLITKYGGVASHMAIRCAELNLPAAIGCGELLYDKLLNCSKIYLDCKNSQVTILEHEKSDKYIEEKRLLKSLGYIK